MILIGNRHKVDDDGCHGCPTFVEQMRHGEEIDGVRVPTARGRFTVH